MAEAFAKRLGKEHLEASSAGSKPSGRINPTAVEVMRDHGIDMSGNVSKGLSELPDQSWDYVVTMGCGDACPFVPSQARLDWQIPDPKGQTTDRVREIAGMIQNEVTLLVQRAITDGYGSP